MSDLVGYPEDRFSRVASHIKHSISNFKLKPETGFETSIFSLNEIIEKN